MVLNKEIINILRDYRLDVDSSLLCLLAIYFKLNVNVVIPEEIIKGINLTKIVEKDPTTRLITWNIPLFEGQQTEWSWVADWNNIFGNINPERKDSLRDVTKRMQEFFKQYPAYRMQDVQEALKMYLSTVTSPTYLKSSAKFIFEGAGATKMSHLAKWCEKVVASKTNPNDGMKGRMAGQ